MRPFEFIILFFSFIYTLALTHLLFAATRMVRHRRTLVFSWPHALWMAVALMLLVSNWISLWDFHTMEALPLPVVAVGFVIVVVQYFVCALVAPDFEDGEGFDLRAFHERERVTYLSAFLAMVAVAVAANYAAGAAEGVQTWSAQNLLVLTMALPPLAGMFVRARWVQVAAPLAALALTLTFLPLYYPVLR